MLLAATDYVRPDTLADAVAALAGNENARSLAWGQSLKTLRSASMSYCAASRTARGAAWR